MQRCVSELMKVQAEGSRLSLQVSGAHVLEGACGLGATERTRWES